MRHVLLLWRKDLLRRRRSPLGVIVMIAFPLIFAGMLAVVFGGDGDSGVPRAKILLENHDDGLAGRMLTSIMGSDEMRERVDVVLVGEEGRKMMDDGEASALFIIPAGLTDSLLRSEPVKLGLVRNPEQTILPEVAEQMAGVLVDVLDLATRLLHRQSEVIGIADLSVFDVMSLSEEDFSRFAVASRRVVEVVQQYVDGAPLALETVDLGKEEEETEESENDMPLSIAVFLTILPGVSCYSLFVIGDQTMRDVLVESTAGTLTRQLSAPISIAHVLAAKVLVSLTVGMVALAILTAMTAAVVPHGGVDILGFVLLAMALVISASGFSALIYGVSTTEQQGAAAASVIYLLMAFSGGSFVPLETMPAVVQQISPISPFYWATEGFKSLLLSGAGVADVAQSIAILGGLGVTLLAAGSFLLQRKVLKGNAL
jgi:ABC-2 type transport system permease protein